MELKECSFDIEKKDFLVKSSVLCEVLNCTAKTITNYVNKGLPFIEVGKQKAFYVGEVKEWIDKEILKVDVVDDDVIENENLESEFSFLGNREFKQFEKYYNELLSEYQNITTLHRHLVKDLAMLLLQKEKIYFSMLFESEFERIKSTQKTLDKLKEIKKEVNEFENMLDNEVVNKDIYNDYLTSLLKNEFLLDKVSSNVSLELKIELKIKMLDFKINTLENELSQLQNKLNSKKSDDLKMSENTIRELSLITSQIEKIVKILRTLEA